MGTVTILPETVKDPISLIGRRAGVCYGADISDPEKNYERGLDCINSGHGRTLEFVDAHMILDGYSARAIREYTRHIGGMTPWLQASTRYIDYRNFDYIVPDSVKKNKETYAFYNDAMDAVAHAAEYLTERGISREDVANILPLGMETRIVEKRNLRNLADMSHVRKCSRAYWEIRNGIFTDIESELSNYSKEWETAVKLLFVPKCELYGYCNEKKSCGRKPRRDDGNGKA